MDISNTNNNAYILSQKHLQLLNNIFRKQHHSHNLSKLQTEVLDWAQAMLSDEREAWSQLRANSVGILCQLERKDKALKRAAAKNKRYEPFKKIFKQLQEEQFKKYQKTEKVLSANAFVKWFQQNKASSMTIPYLESNQTNQLIKLAQINNRGFKKLSNAEADVSPTVED